MLIHHRTGRAGRSGLATVLVHGRQVGIAKRVLGASIAGQRIEPVPELSNLESVRNKAAAGEAARVGGGNSQR